MSSDGTTLLAPLRARFAQRRPIRAGSLIVTLYGDCIQPRGGALWLGSINTLMAPFAIEPGLVRTALSRLVAEGWFERRRVGRNSYYRLSPRGAAEFAAAARRIYAGDEERWSGVLQLAVLTTLDPKVRQERREALACRGYGQLAPNVLVRPASDNAADEGTGAEDVLRLAATVDTAGPLRELTSTCWNMDALAAAYSDLLRILAALSARPDDLRRLRDAQAFEARLLLVHEWRRILLRDPRLPRELLPADWPGSAAREACRLIYRATRAGADRWLDAHGVNEHGALPAADASASLRFETD
jgi:phenylacetic acid degradation operon negative regulatory protein